MRLVLSFLLFLGVCGAASALAQNDTSSFNIRVFGGVDTEEPSTPVLLNASPITSNQINVNWSVAIDNFAVSGYVVFRGGVPIATTTLATYSDTGLTASTSYIYSVKAFDQSFNYSSSSNVLTSVTPPTPPAVVGTESNGNGTAARIVLNELRVNAGMSTSTFFIKTARPARFEMRWGRTSSYELGSVINNSFTDSYTTNLSDLEPGTTYQYEVIGYTPLGKAFVLERGSFFTLGPSDVLPPANVNTFTASAKGADIQLSWNAPAAKDFKYVRIVRSNIGFPTHPQDGVVVYQGTGDRAVDENVLSQFSPVYYTLFVVDVNGAVSSGAVAVVYATTIKDGESQTQLPAISKQDDALVTENATASTSPLVPPGTRMPDVAEIFLLQDNRQVSFTDANLELDSSKPFLLSIPKGVVSEYLKTIIVSLTDPTDSRQMYSFLLRLNKAGTAYEAVLSPVMVDGVSRITINIYDYKSLEVATYKKSVRFVGTEKEPIFPDFFIREVMPFASVTVLPLVLIFWILLLYRRSRKQLEDKI